MALRWRKTKRPKGIASITAGPSGHTLYDGEIKLATVSASRVHYQVYGWYWVAGWSSGIEHKNTSQTPVADEITAKAQALEYVRDELKRINVVTT